MNNNKTSKKIFVFFAVILSGALLPFIARIPGIFAKGKEYFYQYTFNVEIIFGIIFYNIIPFFIFAILNHFNYKRKKAAVIGAGTALFFADFFFHASLDLASSSTAAIALIFIPFYLCIAMAIGYALGYFVAFFRKEKM